MNRINQQWLLSKRPDGPFTPSHFTYHEAPVPKVENNQVLLKTLYLSCDPSQRVMATMDSYVDKVELNTPMRSFGIGQVVETHHPKFKVGDLVFALVNWQSYCLVDFNQAFILPPRVLPGFLDPEQAITHVITGLTAYFGLLDIGQPKAGETVLISGAAGAVGSMAAQIARIKGCKVVGLCGSDEKCDWLENALGVDTAINYKTGSLPEKIQTACPEGIDVFFDNVGGEILEIALHNLAKHARVVLSGAISQYNQFSDTENLHNLEVYGIRNTMVLIGKNALIKGFLVTDYRKQFLKGLLTLERWNSQGKIRTEMDIAEGFDAIPSALIRLFDGKNTGKQLIKVCDAPLPLNVNRLQKTLWHLFKRLIW